MNNLKNFSLYCALLDNHSDINKQLIKGLELYIDDSSTRKTHEFYGRYENIYIDTARIPELGTVLDAAISYSAQILECPDNELKAGLWFNVMQPGDKTTLHKHDDDDELLSAVYYVEVAENSGLLLLEKPPISSQVTPQVGMFVFFPPDMPHEVTENLSQHRRVSLGINIGPAHLVDD